MDVFQVHERLIADYDEFTTSLVHVRDERIGKHLADERQARVRWPYPWVSLNPSFAGGGTISELVESGLLHPMCKRLFRIKADGNDPGARPISLHRHQREAVEAARDGGSYVLTTGTGSGKSLTYMVPIVDSVLRNPEPGRVKAIVVYPMNALANSQLYELERFLEWGLPRGERPVSFARYTGQESDEQRNRILARKPDILLTNYVMLEYLLTRPDERRALIGAAQGLRFLVLDELHTYRGRQGADVGLLVRRLRDACDAPDLQCVGTSATMATTRTFAEAQEVVAEVATRLFGTPVSPERVIGETLVRATADKDPAAAELIAGMARAGSDRSYGELADDPLACWIESEFGLAAESGSGRLTRRRPAKVATAAEALHEATSRPVSECATAIERLLQEGARAQHPETGRPLFAFRLHQFLSKGDTTYVSLEPEDERYITSQYQVSVPGEREKILLPLAFCRECGQEYAVVVKNKDGSYSARQEANVVGGDAVNGYLYISTTHPWPADPVQESRLPDSWLEPAADGGTQVRPYMSDRLPREVWLGPGGSEVPRGEGLQAWYVPSPFRFCLRCRVAYEQSRGRDFAKLATFATEGRSSAVSIISTSIVRSLREQSERKQLDEEARKLLTFVDNRQDASLQAGHLNDFVQVAQLRGALYHAAKAAGEDGLRHDDVAQRVAKAMNLPLSAFALNPEVKFGQKEAVLKAFRSVLAYLIYLDLERGWRITMPNLEQTGLLRFDYIALDEIAADTEHWTNPVLRTADAAHRAELARLVLDEMRRALAVDVEELTPEGYERILKQSTQHLTGAWTLTDGGSRDNARTVFAQPGRPGESRDRVNFTGRSALGAYLRRHGAFPNFGHKLGIDDAQLVIADLLETLTKYGLLIQVEEGRDRAKGYRLKSSELIWRAGDGSTGASDPLRKTVDPEVGARVNRFFRNLYTQVATDLVGVHAAEHTAQVRTEDRQEREQQFREGKLPLLYCSPTMELGVDIATLNSVAMRNVPPTPANYAQRSGRAGRSGQPALITTYCSTGSSHDQYYFRRSDLMVAGSVQPPRLDLTNEDLVRSHVHAVWLAETGVHLHSQMTDVIDISRPDDLPIHEHIRLQLTDESARRRAVPRATRMLATILERERLGKSAWWYEGWIEDTVRGAAERFDAACGRWRDLYRAAIAEQAEQNRRVLDHASTPGARRQAQQRRLQAENQLRLLKNEDSEQQFSDFYTYRYFASEGFLPGYSFPRLPLAAYIPGRKQRGTYVQRPRFIAIGEFGPGALIYHEGQRYQVASIQVPAGESGDVATAEARVCAECGYWHDRQAGADTCDECDAELGGSLAGLMHLQTVHTVLRQRISSDEEERRRAGFELQTTYRFSTHGAGRSGRLQAGVEGADGSLAELVYGDTATVRVLNRGHKGRRNRNDVGYWLDPIRGRWLSESKASERAPEDEGLTSAEEAQRVLKVVPFVEDRKNICVIRLTQPVSPTATTTLRYALERGIEAEFQLEDAELTSEELPDPHDRARMLFIESAEGGAGVLRRLHDDWDALGKVARRALEIIHVDPATGEDLGHAPGARERCERGCYDCLLSYTNQFWHEQIDRLAVIEILRELAAAQTRPSSGHRTAEEHVGSLRNASGSELERDFVNFLRAGEYRLPDGSQELVADARAKPDFIYRTKGGNIAIFVDGPHHDAPHVHERDIEAEDRLMDLGWLVIRFRHDEEWDEIVRRYPSVFGTGRSGR
ncbi:DEAD/DEAH box helicase [Microtetraspora malaysiensis]|uniref:DEAD/DEAH box helicase n=1 Tax=Microtetraspora malaysiensis TaxID=161358 RepID=UPI0008296AE3|nr:DEAD/DEAH box helicase [Microtetraspora malaysiensis]